MRKMGGETLSKQHKRYSFFIPSIIILLAVLLFSSAYAVDVESKYYTTSNPFYPKYGLPNCTCFAWGRAYEVLGKRPNLSTGNACSFWQYNINNKYYPYGNEPQPLSIACWYGTGEGQNGNNGHVAFVESVSGNNVTISQSGWGWRNSRPGVLWENKTLNKSNMNSIQTNFQGYIYLEDLSGDHTAPTISQSRIGDVTPAGINIFCTATDNTYIKEIEFGVWNSAISIDSAKWYSVGAQKNIEAHCLIPFSDFQNAKGVTYYINVRVSDFAGNISAISRLGEIYIENVPPVITSATIENITPMGYDVVCTASDNSAVAKIQIGTWHSKTSVDNAIWQEKASDGNRTVIHVNIADFDYVQETTYHTNVYAFDKSGNVSDPVLAGNPYIEKDLSELVKVTNVSTGGYDLVVTAAGYPGADGLRIGTWHSQMNIDDAVWQNLDGANGTFHVSTADFGGAINVVYYTNLYIRRSSDGYSEPVRAANIMIEDIKPIITSATIKNITPMGYDVVCTASDNSAVAKIQIGTWHSKTSVDNAIWQEKASDGNRTVIHVNIADFDYVQETTYHTNVYAFDKSGNVSDPVLAGNPYIEKDLSELVKVKNISMDGYDLVVTATGYPNADGLRIGTWHSQMNVDDAVWQNLDGANGTFHVSTADFGGAIDVIYHTNLYIHRSSGDYSGAVRIADIKIENAALGGKPDLFLPASLTAIESEAFIGVSAESVFIPRTVEKITGDPFANSKIKRIYGYKGSEAENFAKDNPKYTFVTVDEGWVSSNR